MELHRVLTSVPLVCVLRNTVLNVKEWKWHGDSAAGISLTLIPFGELSCCVSWQMSHH